MNRSIIVVVIAISLFLSGFGLGWAWRGDRADGAQARQEVAATGQALSAVQDAREAEGEQAQALANIGSEHEKDRSDAAHVPDAVVAGLRDGNLRLRDDLATCHTDRLSESAASASQRDESAQLRAEVAGDLVRVGRDADDQLRACQAVVQAGR